MQSNRLSAAVLAALLVTGFQARAATLCTAGNPDTTSLAEATPTSAFADNVGATTHLLTGLMWKKCPEGMVSAGPFCGDVASTHDWKDALVVASRDVTAGFADWRLPNAKELLSIVETCGHNPAINLAMFPATPSGQFWSSTTVAGDPFNAISVDFGSGETFADKSKSSTFLRVRLVRGGDAVSARDWRNPVPAPASCSADFDGNGTIDALTDGLLFIRAAFGLTGTSVTTGAVGAGASRSTWASIRSYMNTNCGTSFAL